MLCKILALTAAAGATLTVAGTAYADPHQESLPLDCGGTTLTMAVAPANGTFTPNFDTGSTAVFKPTQITVGKQVYDQRGAVGAESVATRTLGQGKQASRVDSVVCRGSETLPGEWVGLPEGESLLVTMTATGFFTPR